jgi:hypothetical protein
MRALISRSNDGEFIARTVEKLGFPSIRGSSAKKTDLAKNKHGEQAFRDMVQWVRDGGGVAITPDGPRGPAEHMEKGTPSLARITGAPVIFVGLAAKPCIRLGSWDNTMIPLPFAKAAMVWDGPTGAAATTTSTSWSKPGPIASRRSRAGPKTWSKIDQARPWWDVGPMPHDHTGHAHASHSEKGHDHDHHDHGHAHDHGHSHGHHGHSHAPKDFGRAFAIGTALNLGFVLIEAAPA